MKIHELNTRTPSTSDYLALDNGTQTYKAKTGDLKPEYSSSDMLNPTTWTDFDLLGANAKLTSVLEKITKIAKNVRYFRKLIGSGSFSNVAATIAGAIGNTALPTTATSLSGAIAEHEGDISNINADISTINGNLTPSVESISSSYSTNVRIFRYGNLRILVIETVTGITASGDTDICTLPDNDKPSAQVNQDFFEPSGSNVTTTIRAYVTAGGVVRVHNYSTKTSTMNIRIRIPYLVGV